MPRLKPTIRLLKVDNSLADVGGGTSSSTPDPAYAAAQANGFAQRHGWAMADDMDADLSSSGWIDGRDQGSIDRHPNSAGAPQAPGASATADKSAKLAKAGSCAHSTTEKNQYGVITCRDCKSWWCDDAAFKAMTGIARATHLSPASGAQKCADCGAMWLTADTGVLKACRSCGSGSLIDPAASFAKSATREASGCNHTNASKTLLSNGTTRCDRCGALKGTVPSNQSTCAPLSKSAQALSQSQSTALSKTASKRSDDRVRGLVATALYDAAKKTTNPVTRGKLEKLAQGIDSGSYPVPPELALRFDSVRLSTGLPSVGSGRSTWQERHGF